MDIHQLEIFHGEISVKDAEGLLNSDWRRGNYLVRHSSTIPQEIIITYINQLSKTLHFVVNRKTVETLQTYFPHIYCHRCRCSVIHTG